MSYDQDFMRARVGEKFHIKPKRDFGKYGFWINRQFVKSGFVVCKGGCNVMPGATWFLTIPEALKAAEIYVKVDYDAQAFWAEMQRAANARDEETANVH
jgi:hypothetical protein